GYCLFSLDYGNRATGDIAASAKTLKKFVTRVRSATGAPKVSLVGHSQGGMMPRYYLKFLGGAKHVDDLIGIAPSNHGTSLVGNFAPVMGVAGPVLDIVCRACTQQGTRSAFLKRLNAGDETPGDVSYTQITTVQDEIVVPHISGYLEAGPRTTNLTLQDACPTAFAEHLLLPGNKAAIAWTLDALSHPGPASKSLEPAC
ncbi:MAG: lipase family protein, partial [Nocardioides sp.]|nr:lipase family protein [Nocardioides sp.]